MPEETKSVVAPAPAPSTPAPSPAVARPAVSSPRPVISSAKPPTQEALAVKFDVEPDLDLGDSPKAIDEVRKSESKPVESKPSEAVPAVETQQAVKPVVETTTAKPTNPLLGEIVKPGETRDYTGFTQEEVGVLKQMSNPAFTLATKLIKDNRELAKLKDSTYIQHPEAYRLDPAYKKQEEDITYLSKEAQIWKNQLINIKLGKEWTPLVGWDKAGNPVYEAKRMPSELDEENVRSLMQQTEQSANQMKGQLKQMEGSYIARVGQDNAQIDEIQKSKFSWVNDPALLDKTVSVSGQDRTIKQVREDFMSMIPAYHRGHKLAELSSNMFAGLLAFSNEVASLRAQLQIAETKRGDALRAEPTSKETPANSGGVAKSKFGGPATFDAVGLPD